ncbi:dihydrofolate reductase [Thermosporothrix hazakensis]|jgi:dihydrofolate reductase|uniref:Dihydrofolate reductase n=2 Tax=Thermosporothrix TaxID=768650 RepID=A0A326U9B5_THEHA|nr:dihydrofolate reductase family protein [Thermosporothrix hazakensis]PZW32610.1 dihydrofolate reductase [Thermosporothrix hazakensis]BBH87522.1 pyrimidine reductase [Thermosporothrix sp. COM3]GCE49963.1 pyrimidine reductase [Thermosporothrix hazakensis]
MRKIITTTWISLDGKVAGPNGEMDWVGESYDKAMGLYESEFVRSADTLLLGRVTYQSFAGSWPYVPDNPNASEEEKEYARQLTALEKIVFSRTLEKAEWNNSRLVREVNADEIRQLKQGPGRNIIVYGSISLIQALTELGLIDEYQILVHPVVLGGGKPLFPESKNRVKLQLVETKTHPSGVVLLTYQPKAL